MSSAGDEPAMVVYPPASILEPWTRRRLRRVADGHGDIEALLDRLGRQRQVTTTLDPAIDRHLADTAAAWTNHMAQRSPDLPSEGMHALVEATLSAGYLFGRLLVGTADIDQNWSSQTGPEAVADWLDEIVPMTDWSGIADLIDTNAKVTTATLRTLVGEMLEDHGMATGHQTLAIRAPSVVDNGLCVALIEHSAVRPLADHPWVDLTVTADLLPDDTLERVWIGEALGCLLARVDRKGRCSETELRDAADELGGERGHRYFRHLREWGLIDYDLTGHGTGSVRVPRHRELRGGPAA